MSRGSPRPSSPERQGSSRRQGATTFSLLDVVRVRQPVPEHGIRAGDEGTIVEIRTEPEGYLVDFSYEPGFDGHTLPVYSLTSNQLEVVRRHERSLA
jgi:hypothetical protein